VAQSYTYQITTDFPSGGCFEDNLVIEIRASSIATALQDISRNGDVLSITFVSALSAGDKTTLDNDTSNPAGGLIAAHNPTPPTEAANNAGNVVLTPPTIGSSQNNYNPTGFGNAGLLRIAASTAVNVTGLAAGATGRLVQVHNVGSFNITLTDSDTNSTAANRFSLRGAASFILTPNKTISLQYDATSARWRAIGADDPYGTTTSTVCQGTDSRLSDARTPTGAAGGDLSGTFANPTVAQSSIAFALTGVLSPASIGANQNDYNPASLSTAAVLRLTSSGAFNITGLAGGASGRILVVHNIGSFAITLKDEDAGSTAANRFALTADMSMSPDSVALLQYDSTTSRWRAISGGGSGGSPSGPASQDLGGTYPGPLVLQSSTTFALTGIISPTTIGADQNDYTPTGLSTANTLRLSASTPGFSITGITGGADGRLLVLTNVGSFPITLTDEGAGSTAANRFSLQDGTDLTLNPEDGCIIRYDSTSSRWRVFGASTISACSRLRVGPADATRPIPAGYFAAFRGGPSGNGVFISAGEAEGDILLHIEDQDGTLTFAEVHADDGQWSLGATYAATLAARGFVHGMDNQWAASGLRQQDYNTQFGGYRVAGALVADNNRGVFAATLAIDGVITPTTIAANTNDYAPTGIATASFLRLSASTPGFSITGLTTGSSGRVVAIHNVGSFPITLTDEGAGSTAANRFALTDAANLVLQTDECVILHYDSTSTRWRAVSASRQATAAPGATGVATASAEGTASTLARSDHAHQSNTAPANVTKAAAAIGTSGEPARADHKHDVTTAAPAATGVATASAEGTATTLARSDHAHQSNTAPANVTKAAAAIGTSGEPARADHKHDITTAAAAANPPGSANAEGTSTSLSRADHVHALAAFGSATGTFCQGDDARLSDARTPTGAAGGDLSGTFANPTVKQSSIAFALAGILSPAQITADQNDYNPASLSTANTMRINSDAARTVTGLQGGATGRILVIENVGSFPITLSHESASSTAANRFSFASLDVVLGPGHSITLAYDGTSSRWRNASNTVERASGAFSLNGTLSPAQITANQNDYSPTGLSNVVLLRINTDAARNITGIATGADGRMLVIVNTGSFVISLLHESASSTAANRFTFDSADINLAPSACVVLLYDNTSSRWRAIGTATPPRARTPVVATGTITTASTTDVLATSMTDTPTAGVWLAIFRGGYGNSTATALSTVSIWFNGSQVSGTEAGSDEHNANYRTPFMTCAVITTTGVGAVEGRWRVSAGTGSMLNRSLILLKLVA